MHDSILSWDFGKSPYYLLDTPMNQNVKRLNHVELYEAAAMIMNFREWHQLAEIIGEEFGRAAHTYRLTRITDEPLTLKLEVFDSNGDELLAPISTNTLGQINDEVSKAVDPQLADGLRHKIGDEWNKYQLPVLYALKRGDNY